MTEHDNGIPPEQFALPPHSVTAGTLYPDGWCVPYLGIDFPGLRGLVRIDVEFWNPPMSDVDPNDVVIRANHRGIGAFRDLSPEQIESVQHEMIVGEGGLFLSIRSAGRRPPSGSDLRPLALIIRRLSVEQLSEQASR